MNNHSAVTDALSRIGQLVQQGMWDEAEKSCLQVVSSAPGEYAGWLYLGIVALHKWRLDDAEAAFERAINLNPNDPSCWHNLSGVLRERGRAVEAETCARRSLDLNGSNAAYWDNLGEALYAQGRCDEASQAYHQALTLNAMDAAAWRKFGLAEEASLRLDNAEQAFQASLALAPKYGDARLSLANLQLSRGSFVEAEEQLHQVLADDPQNANAWSLLGGVKHNQAQRDEATAALRRAVTLRPDPSCHSRLLHSLQYADDVTPEQLLNSHRQWDTAYARPLRPARSDAKLRRDVKKPLRLGLFYANTGLLPTISLVLPALECLNRTECSIVCYSDRMADDEYTARFRAAADVCHMTGGLSVECCAEQVRRDEIDILVDLAGHASNRLLVFARRPAPLQATRFGYVGTTGLTAMDCLIADRFHLRPGEEVHYAETVLRMPNGYACYGAPAYAPDIGPLPALSVGRVTFGCFNNSPKYSRLILDAWAQILRRVPTAALLLKSSGLDDPKIQADFRGRLVEQGVEPERILIEGWSPPHELMAHYNRIDLALDTQPYSGGLTTCEALWMGVPVVTFPGKTFAGRHSVSHLTNAGYGQFIAADSSAYIDLAVEWANRLAELSVIRPQISERMRQSPLCGAPTFARNLLTLLRQARDDRVVAIK